ncbi:DNA-3-methyladenine glycosylase [Motiliproteus sp. SC1-56]|uniref:DNA-3-methyladenine glycosylase family protein n=1 Tax=Motiliproteus sp. SC1-56 TaxID=2799565 RepID=UPI001F5DF580|nr:DNA-3-methyladenine glycosylase 2 family protein [Motiliproteus sp. SC1-56]
MSDTLTAAPGAIHRAEGLNNALAALADIDPHLGKALAEIGSPSPRARPRGFETLVSAIIGQQISKAAATAVEGRVRELLPEFTPRALLALEVEQLRAAGLSGRKVEYAQGLATAVESGALDLEALDGMDDQAAIEAISALRGFGRWSAEIYLMFSLGRPDIFPADDLALRVALGRLKGLDERPTAGQARKLVSHWAPWRSAGALFLWHYYRAAPL